MSKIGSPVAAAREKAADELGDLQRQIASARAALAHVQRDLDEATSRLDRSDAARLLDANEQLVFAMLRAQTDADKTALALKEVSRSAELDALTRLPNRVLLLDRLVLAIASAKRRDSRLAVMFLDLDHFKEINDTLGHAAGDQVLKRVAHCLTSSVRETDTVSRHGGDEFVILLTEIAEASDAILIADKVIALLGAPSHIGAHVLRLTASIGISIYPDDGTSADVLIDRADAAMYSAKRLVPGGQAFFEDEPLIDAGYAVANATLAAATPGGRDATPPDLERRRARLREADDPLVRSGQRHAELALRDSRKLVEAERAARQQVLEDSLHEKEVLLKEIHHRVKNNLQVISSLLQLQAGYLESDETRRIFEESQGRIRSMALVHEKLYQSKDMAHVDFGDYVRDLVAGLVGSYRAHAERVSIEVDAASVQLDVDRAIPCGLIVNELVSNSFKHGFPDGRVGRIRVELSGGGAVPIELTVQDDGVGWAEGFDPAHSASLGLKLVHILARQLHATLHLDSEHGVRCALTLSARPSAPQVRWPGAPASGEFRRAAAFGRTEQTTRQE